MSDFQIIILTKRQRQVLEMIIGAFVEEVRAADASGEEAIAQNIAAAEDAENVLRVLVGQSVGAEYIARRGQIC